MVLYYLTKEAASIVNRKKRDLKNQLNTDASNGNENQGNFYRIEPINDTSPLWDLYLLRKVNSKTNPREEFQLEGYGMPLDSAIGRIIRYAINSKYGKDEITTLKEYLNVFKQIQEEIYKEVGR